MRQTDNLFNDLNELDWENVLPFKYIVIHSSDTEDGPGVNASAIEKWHKMHNGWAEVGYNFLVECAPENNTKNAMSIFVGRPMNRPGAHAEGFNMKGIGVCCVGDFSKFKPDQRHWETTAYVCMLLMKFFKEKRNVDLQIIGHRDVYKFLNQPVKKECPGKMFDMTAFKAAVRGA